MLTASERAKLDEKIQNVTVAIGELRSYLHVEVGTSIAQIKRCSVKVRDAVMELKRFVKEDLS